MRAEPARVRRLDEGDLAVAARLASAAFREDPFYRAVLGLEPAAFDAYWSAFLPLAMRDRHSRVYGIEAGGSLAGVLVTAVPGFPSALRGLVFLARLARRIGLRRLVRYLRFVRAYERALHRPRRERHLEARGLWLLVEPGHGPGLGTTLTRRAMEIYAGEGRSMSTGFADAGNRRLLDFYRRLGFGIRLHRMPGGVLAALIEHRAAAWEGGATC